MDRAGTFAFHLTGELSEMMDALGYRSHRPFRRPESDNARMEWVDAFKYLLAIATLMDWDPAQLVANFYEKSDVVDARLERWSKDDVQVPVVMVDIDGILCDDQVFTDRQEMNGVYRDVTARPDVVDLFNTLREQAGLRIVICTTRPAWKHRSIEQDTELWLAEVGVEYDALHYAGDKHEEMKQYPNLRFVVEDSPKHALDFAQNGTPVVQLCDSSDVPVSHANIIPVYTSRQLTRAVWGLAEGRTIERVHDDIVAAEAQRRV